MKKLTEEQIQEQSIKDQKKLKKDRDQVKAEQEKKKKAKYRYVHDLNKIRRLLEVTEFDHLLNGKKNHVNIGNRGSAKTFSSMIIGADRWLNPECKDSIAVAKYYIKDNVGKSVNSFKQAVKLLTAELEFILDETTGKAIDFKITKTGHDFEEFGYEISPLQSPVMFHFDNPNKMVKFFGFTRVDAIKGESPVDSIYNVYIVDEFLPESGEDVFKANSVLDKMFYETRLTFWRPDPNWTEEYKKWYREKFPPLAIYNTNPAELMSIGILYDKFFETTGYEPVTTETADKLIEAKFLLSEYGDEIYKGGLNISHTTYLSNRKYPEELLNELDQIKREDFQAWVKLALGLEPMDFNSPFVASFPHLQKLRSSEIFKAHGDLSYKDFYKEDGVFWGNFNAYYVDCKFGLDLSVSRHMNVLIGAAITSWDFLKNELHYFTMCDIDPKKSKGNPDDDERIYKKLLTKLRWLIQQTKYKKQIEVWVDSANEWSRNRLMTLLKYKEHGFEDIKLKIKFKQTGFKTKWRNSVRTNQWNILLPQRRFFARELKEPGNDYVLWAKLKQELAINRITSKGEIREGTPDDVKQACEYAGFFYWQKMLRAKRRRGRMADNQESDLGEDSTIQN